MESKAKKLRQKERRDEKLSQQELEMNIQQTEVGDVISSLYLQYVYYTLYTIQYRWLTD